MDNTSFDFFSNRLHFIDVANDHLLNIELWHCLSAFESHVFGIVMQYNRIRSELDIRESNNIPAAPGPQARLDIYYYILTWDKLKKIYGQKIKAIVNRLQETNPSMPKTFGLEFRVWKNRIDHLFSEFVAGVRNEYEHPSLEPYSVGNIVTWGTILIDGSGNIKAHAGKNWFASIKNEHCARIQALRTDLFDLFLKHFSQKPLTQELIKVRTHIEENADSMLGELEALKDTDDTVGFNKLLHSLLMQDVYLSKEDVPLSTTVRNKLYSMLAGKASINT